MEFKIKSITATIHDTGFGGYPYKVIVMVEMPSKVYSKLPILQPARMTLTGRKDAKRDLGQLVLEVNNAVYALNRNIPSYSPSIDSQGSTRAKNGIKTMEFVYFFKDHNIADKLGYKLRKFKSGEISPEYSQYIDLLSSEVAS